jgi:ribonuclease BN (tRNA processing enzyme)
VVDATTSVVTTILKDEDLEVSAIGVPHANSPSVAYRVRVGKFSLGFSGDQTGRDSSFVRFAKDADVLVMHLALSTHSSEGPERFRATPSTVGQVAG